MDPNTPVPIQPEIPQGRNSFITKKLIIIVLIIVIIVMGGLIVVLTVSKRGPISSSGGFLSAPTSIPSPKPSKLVADVLLATVGNQPVYKSMVTAAAQEQYAPNAITEKVLKQFFDTVVERKILDQEAAKENITVTESEIDNYLTQNKLSSKSYNTAKYQILKTKIVENQVQSVSIYMIGFWIPSVNFPLQKPEYPQERIDAKSAVTEAYNEFLQGKSVVDIANNIDNKYPNLQQLLTINGYPFKNSHNPALFEIPLNYPLVQAENGKNFTDPNIVKEFKTLQPNNVILANTVDGSGQFAVKCVDVSLGKFTSYNDFLAAKKAQLLKIMQKL